MAYTSFANNKLRVDNSTGDVQADGYSDFYCEHATVSSAITQTVASTALAYPTMFESDDDLLGMYRATSTVTVSSASPCVVTWANHKLSPGAPVRFTNSGGALPTGLAAGTTYYVAATDFSSGSFKLCTAYDGTFAANVNTSDTGTGTHTCTCISRLYFPTSGDYEIFISALVDTTNNAARKMDLWFVRGTSSTVTITNANPGVVTWANHGMAAGHVIVFSSTGSVSGITMGQAYYVIATDLTTNTFKFSATAGGGAVDTTGTQTGTHTCACHSGMIIPKSNTQAAVDSVGVQAVVSVALIIDVTVGDYIRLDYRGDGTTVRLLAVAEVAANPGVTPAIPACPSVILTMKKIGR